MKPKCFCPKSFCRNARLTSRQRRLPRPIDSSLRRRPLGGPRTGALRPRGCQRQPKLEPTADHGRVLGLNFPEPANPFRGVAAGRSFRFGRLFHGFDDGFN